MPILRKRYTKNYTVISNVVAGDSVLSYKARGIFLYLWHLPDDWEISLADIEAHSQEDGQHSIRTGVAELERKGYLCYRRIRAAQGGRFLDAEWILGDTPSLDFPKMVNPTLDNPTTPKYEEKLSTKKEQKPFSDAAACERRAERDPSVVSGTETTHLQRQPKVQGYHLLNTTPWEQGPLLDYTCERYAAMFAETYGHPHPRITPKKLHNIYDTLALAYDDAHLDVTEEEQIDELIVAHLATTTTDGKLYAFAMLHHLGFLALGHPEQPCTLHQDFIEELGDVRRQAAERKSRLQGVGR